MFTPVTIVLVAMATIANARTVSNRAALLVDKVQAVADALPNPAATKTDNARSATDTQGPDVYIPGRSNICEYLCPKWCQKINGTTTDSTNCHYLCGNLCVDKTTWVNPFIGNARYEVVPSDFRFGSYDKNGDKMISVEEFARTERVSMDEVMDLFLFADMNGDKFIDTQEFHGGPLVFTVQMAAELSAMAAGEKKTTTTPAPPETVNFM